MNTKLFKIKFIQGKLESLTNKILTTFRVFFSLKFYFSVYTIRNLSINCSFTSAFVYENLRVSTTKYF